MIFHFFYFYHLIFIFIILSDLPAISPYIYIYNPPVYMIVFSIFRLKTKKPINVIFGMKAHKTPPHTRIRVRTHTHAHAHICDIDYVISIPKVILCPLLLLKKECSVHDTKLHPMVSLGALESVESSLGGHYSQFSSDTK